MVKYNRQHWQQQQSEHNVTCVLLTLYVVAFFPTPLVLRSPIYGCSAHLIQQVEQYHDYRSNGYPRPHLPQHLPEPLEQQPGHSKTRELTPAECMVDLTNDLAFRILHYHSILNRNNFAFSPTALMSVLVALYEGSTGRSASEIQNVLKLPDNRDIIRVGYRDIHRRLRTYFFSSDNPLKGLSLHKENVTITRDYEAILMFYGYDLGIDMVSSTIAPTSTTSSTLTPPVTSAENETATTMPNISITEVSSETATEATTTIVETTDTTDTTATTATTATTDTTATTATTPTTPTTTTTPMTTTPMIATTTAIDTSASTATVTVMTLTTTTLSTEGDSTDAPTVSETTTVTSPNEIESTITSMSQETTDENPAETTSIPATAAETPINEAAELISSFVAETNPGPLLRLQKARVTRLPSAKLQAPLATKQPQVNYLPSIRKSKRLSTNRSKRHVLGFKAFDSNLFVSLFKNDALLGHLPTSLAAYNAPFNSYVPVSDQFEVDTEPNFISTATAAIKQNYNTDVITHVFYLSTQQIIYTTFKVYNAVLYYKYFEHLRMSVLELELDTPEYNLIILLPDYTTDLVTAVAALRLGPRLRTIRKQLKPKWVQAIIPDFKLQGSMFLTNDLQNLGIYDVFEPNRADFRPMTDEPGTYVKHIEQSINIQIRTHPINQLRRNNGAQAQPIQISVNHPFMFFIIDRDLDVAVMSGRILNPLNVRIQ